MRPEGIEPPTPGSEVRCSIQLSYGRTRLFQTLRRRPCQGLGDNAFAILTRQEKNDPSRLYHREQHLNQLMDRSVVGRDDVIGGRLIFRRPLLQHVLNFINERLGPR